MKKRKNIQNSNGITVSDSIIMSVKNKKRNYRKPYSVMVALFGYLSVILSVFGMFSINCNHGSVFLAVCGFAFIYLILSLIEGKAVWIYIASGVLFFISLFMKFKDVVNGCKYVFNDIYSSSYHTSIQYFKGLDPLFEESAVTTMLFHYIWILAFSVFIFTIVRPNPILPLLVTFPVIELGLYNGVDLPVFRGIMVVAFWLALLAMSTIDVGEYSGNSSGFVRRDNVFSPKRHMRLKVTEKCGAIVALSVMAVAIVTMCFMKVTDYKRSQELNQKRRNISDAVNSFSVDSLTESIANLTNAFGLEFRYDNHKLGRFDHVSYKNQTDYTITLQEIPPTALYLKNYAGSVYKNNEWLDLSDSAYEDKRLQDCMKYGINPQDFPDVFAPFVMNGELNAHGYQNTVITAKLKRVRALAPYVTRNNGDFRYDNDKMLKPKSAKENEFSYTFFPSNAEMVMNVGFLGPVQRAIYNVDGITDETWRNSVRQYCEDNNMLFEGDYFTIDHEVFAPDIILYQNGGYLMAELLESNYKSFVYDNYLDVPDTDAMREVRTEYADLIRNADTSTNEGILNYLTAVRNRIAETSEYSLKCGKTPSNRDFVNYFLLENHKGYCTHFATAGVILARMAGIPARYGAGYIVVQDDLKNAEKQDDGSYLVEIKDNRSHAWAEIYINGYGWMPFEFTAGYTDKSINTETTTTTTTTTTSITNTTTTSSDGSQESTSKTSDSSKSTTKRTTAQQITETTQTTAFGIFGHGGKSSFHIPPFVKSLFKWIFFTALCIGAVILRRSFMLKLREKHFKSGKRADRISYIYAYAEKLLKFKKHENADSRFNEFADETERLYSKVYFDDGEFKKLTDIALHARFGKYKPSDDELKFAADMVNGIASKMYSKSGILGKLYLKFISVLI